MTLPPMTLPAMTVSGQDRARSVLRHELPLLLMSISSSYVLANVQR